MNELDFAMEVKALDGDGFIEGLAAGYGNLDHGGDVMLPGAAKKSLDGNRVLPMLMFHDQRRPVGRWHSYEERPEGLLSKGRFAMSTIDGKEAHALVKDGALGGLSMGYNTLQKRIVGKARHLVEVAMHEISLVTVPMNDRTRITSVKDILGDGQMPSLSRFEEFLREAGGFSKSQATAIAGKGLSHLIRSESGSASTADDLWSALRAQLPS